jgi:peptidoglycan/LPS O-acetylase OafA/YrhL
MVAGPTSPSAVPTAEPGRARAVRLESLTIARFVAALLVFVFHASLVGFFAADPSGQEGLRGVLHNLGNFGVAFFFVLSGFVLTWSRRPRDTYRSFLIRRMVRLYPTHWFTSMIALALAGAGGASVGHLLVNMGLLHSWFPDAGTFFSINFPSWSISTELFFYAAFPVLVIPIVNLGPRGLKILLAAVVAAILMLPFLTLSSSFDSAPVFDLAFAASPVHGRSQLTVWFLYIFPVSRCLDFIVGICIARLIMIGHVRTVPVSGAMIWLVVVYVAGLYTPFEWQLAAMPVLAAIPMIVALAQLDLRRPVRGAGWARRMGVQLGSASFAFYLLHEAILKALRQIPSIVSSSTTRQVATTTAVLLISVAGSITIHRWVEEPPLRALARLQRSRGRGVARPND